MNNRRGMALGVVILSAVVFSIAAFVMLTMAMSQARLRNLSERRFRAKYVAEAGLVWAMEQLWANPAYCGVPDPPALQGLNADVTVTNCGTGVDQAVNSKVVY